LKYLHAFQWNRLPLKLVLPQRPRQGYSHSPWLPPLLLSSKHWNTWTPAIGFWWRPNPAPRVSLGTKHPPKSKTKQVSSIQINTLATKRWPRSATPRIASDHTYAKRGEEHTSKPYVEGGKERCRWREGWNNSTMVRQHVRLSQLNPARPFWLR
jgi:hypothetical protein